MAGLANSVTTWTLRVTRRAVALGMVWSLLSLACGGDSHSSQADAGDPDASSEVGADAPVFNLDASSVPDSRADGGNDAGVSRDTSDGGTNQSDTDLTAAATCADALAAGTEGACINTDDCVLIDPPAGSLNDAVACFVPGGDAQTALCIEEEIGLSSDCAGCYVDLMRCGASSCLAECNGRLNEPGCRACIDANGCTADFVACAGFDGGPTTCDGGTEDTIDHCTDGCSNDGDLWIDCDDWDCQGVGACGEGCDEGPEDSDQACSDGCSNDGDAFADCADWDCAGFADCAVDACADTSEDSEVVCSDGCSNDGDLFVDCDDSDCWGVGTCPDRMCPEAGSEDSDEACSDGCDNDDNGYIDCGDLGCEGLAACPGDDCPAGLENTADACDDGCSNDGDDLIDCEETSCEGLASCPATPICDSCEGRACGGDGCGGSCGECDADESCTTDFQCVDSCAAGQTRCVAGSPQVVEACGGTDGWETEACGEFELCTNGACHPVCNLTEAPSDPFICFVPNGDDINDPILWLASDPELAPPYTNIFVAASALNPQLIAEDLVPNDANTGTPAEEWPYEWRFYSTTTALNNAEIQFRLDQLPVVGPGLHHVTFSYQARRHTCQTLPHVGWFCPYTIATEYAYGPEGTFKVESVSMFNDSYNGDFTERGIEVLPIIGGGYRFSRTTTCPTPQACNAMGIQIHGEDGFAPAESWVNWIMLTID